MNTFIGIDVAKDKLDVDSVSTANASQDQAPIVCRGTFSQSSEGHQPLIEQLPEPRTCLVIVEATGGYERAIIAELVEARHLVCLIIPRQIRDFAKALGILAKTDALDARVIARFGQQDSGRFAGQRRIRGGRRDVRNNLSMAALPGFDGKQVALGDRFWYVGGWLTFTPFIPSIAEPTFFWNHRDCGTAKGSPVNARKSSVHHPPRVTPMSPTPTIARDIMVSKLITLRPDMDVFDAIDRLLQNHISGAPVIDADGNFIGVFSERCSISLLVAATYDGTPTNRIEPFIERQVATVSPDTDLLTIAERFLNSNQRRLPVLDGAGRLVGQISRRDVLKAARALLNQPAIAEESSLLYLSGVIERKDAPIS